MALAVSLLECISLIFNQEVSQCSRGRYTEAIIVSVTEDLIPISMCFNLDEWDTAKASSLFQ